MTAVPSIEPTIHLDGASLLAPAEASPESYPGADAIAADGAIIRIRPVVVGDAAGLVDLHERAGDATLYRRFFSTGHHVIAGEVARLTRTPSAEFVALVAEEKAHIVGVCSYELLPGVPNAEFAVFVDDAAHDRGIGTLMLEHLAVYGRRHGVPVLLGEVLSSNNAMLRVATGLGQPLRSTYGPGLIEVSLETALAENDLLDARDLTAARHSLDALFAPRCVAVIGAGRAAGGIGHAVLCAIIDGGFTGTIFAVNPAADTIAGTPAYPSVAAAPVTPDLVIIAVPAANVASVLAEAGQAGARAAVVLSAGFSETGPDGRALQARLVRIARGSGMRLVGPNCLGILNNSPAVRLHATFAAAATPGGLAVASQSGAVGISLLDQAMRAELGVSSFVSLGNKADVSGNDVLSYWYDDPAAKVVALYLESLGNPRRFARIARAVGRRKPVLAIKSGRSATGSRVGASHTAAAAAPDATIDALFGQAGVIRCDGLGDLLDTARMLVDQPLSAGNRLAIVSNAGGINVLCADAADAAALTVSDLPTEAQIAIRVIAPSAAAIANPVDLGAAASANAMGGAIRAIAPHVDAIVVAFGATLAADVATIVTAIGTAIDDIDVPVAVVLLGLPGAPTSVGARRAPVYPLPELAIAALGRAVRYANWRRVPLGHSPLLSRVDPVRARTLVTGALVAGGGWVSPSLAGDLLRCYGIPTCAAQEVTDGASAVDAAIGLGFPVVVKSADPQLVHKTDVGGVRVNLTDAAAVVRAYRDVSDATGDARVLVQSQASAGVELVAGIVHDPLFGSVLMCGLGGVQTDLLGDRSLRLLPLSDRDAAQMWRELHAAPLLAGYRGAAATDTAAVEDLLLRLGRLADDLPEIAELDLNPVIVGPSGIAIVDVKIRIVAVGNEPDAAMRALREPA